MNIGESILLGAFQGVTEFLPISSSGHLVLLEHFLGLPAAKMLPFDVVLHGGTLLAVMILFWRDILQLIQSLFVPAMAKQRRFLLILIIATLPAAIVGFLWEDLFENVRSIKVIASGFLFTGVFFLLAERFPRHKNAAITFKTGIVAGLMQAVALLPGVSRSGSTMAGGLLAGTERGEATRFAFFMSIPITAGVVVLYAARFATEGIDSALPPLDLAVAAFVTATASGYLTARFLLGFFRRYSLRFFAGYLLIAGAALWLLETLA